MPCNARSWIRRASDPAQLDQIWVMRARMTQIQENIRAGLLGWRSLTSKARSRLATLLAAVLTYDAGPTRDLAGEAFASRRGQTTLCVVSGPASRVKRQCCSQLVSCSLTRDPGPKPHIVWFRPRGFLGFAEKNLRGPYIAS